MNVEKIRNVAIIAHVDHGKTTLVDGMLKQTHTFAAHQSEMQETTILDSNDLERERGVTILAKNTAVFWKEFKVNILDTPGHSDFSGEVERTLNMADGCILLVDAAEGVLSQTRYVLNLALQSGITPIVLVNKVDRKDQRTDEVIEEINNLFLDTAVNDEQLDFPILYGVGRDGIVGRQVELTNEHSLRISDSSDLAPLFETIISTVPAPKLSPGEGVQLQVTNLDYDSYRGRYVIGRLSRGTIHAKEPLALLREGKKIQSVQAEEIFQFSGLGKESVNQVEAGDIIALTGVKDAKIGDTLTSPSHQDALPDLPISEPTVQIQFSVSDSPFVGDDGKFTTSRQIGERLRKELETNVSLRVEPGATPDIFLVSGRGELHLSILIETMRREGYEFSVSRPEVVFKEVNGEQYEPWEKVTIEVPDQYIGTITNLMGQRSAELIDMKTIKSGVRFEYNISTRNLIGFRSELLTETSGMGVVHTIPLGYDVKGADAPWQRSGVIIASDTGQVLAYSLEKIQERGKTFVVPGDEVYAGMVIGQNAKKEDIVMNATRAKKATNFRSNADVLVRLNASVEMSLEQCLNFLAPDELLEVTPLHLRLRKRDLSVANH